MHRAHTTWFFETFVLAEGARYRPFDEQFGFLFNSYYEAVGPRWARAERVLLSRPSVERIREYRRHVDRAMHELLATGLSAAEFALLELGLHHEQQHQELLLMDIKHLLSRNPGDGAHRRDPAGPAVEITGGGGWTSFERHTCETGAGGDGFCFDNELPRHSVLIAPFLLANAPVTSGEWCAFIDDGGYGRPELWLSDGWATVQNEGWSAPL